jgi:hypothetical protein
MLLAFFSSKLTYNYNRFCMEIGRREGLDFLVARELEREVVEGKLQTVKGVVVQIVAKRFG